MFFGGVAAAAAGIGEGHVEVLVVSVDGIMAGPGKMDDHNPVGVNFF